MKILESYINELVDKKNTLLDVKLNLSNSNLKQPIASWYKKEYSDDKRDIDLSKKLNQKRTFLDLAYCLMNGDDFFDFIGQRLDKTASYRIFYELADMLRVTNDIVLNTWNLGNRAYRNDLKAKQEKAKYTPKNWR